jgi:DNA-binding response OmpR family regulator
MAPTKFNCIIIDPDMTGRMRLKQATSPVNEFGSVTPLSNINEANSYLAGDKPTDVVFLSARLPQEHLSPFIQSAKALKSGQDAAYVIVTKSASDGAKGIAEIMMLGGDGMLCEPYSVDSLLEITLLSARVRKERSDQREKAAIGMIIKDVINQLDMVACLKANGCELGLSIKKLRDLSAMIHAMSPESRTTYFDVMLQAFIDAPLPPKALGVKKYGGVSSRIKKKMDQKMAEDIQKQMQGDS